MKKIMKNSSKVSWVKILPLAGVVMSLTACGSMRHYQAEMQGSLQATKQGNLDEAVANLEKNNTGSDKDLLYFLEKGQLLRLKGDLAESVNTWLKADEKVRQWEDESKLTVGKALEAAGSVVVNDKVRRYDGQDYEKVMLSTLLTMNHMLSGNVSGARTEIKKTYERESLIASLHEKEYDKVEEEAKSHNVETTFKNLRGYPVETLDDPEVLSLKNGYQSAFSHYLAGFVFESLHEPSLASAGYRKAIELRPNQPLLEQGLKGLQGRLARKVKDTDVLLVVESGFMPARSSKTIPLPFIWKNKPVITQIAFPVIQPSHDFRPSNIQIGNKSVELSPISNLDAMARRALRDEMPGIIVRSSIRAAAKGAMQQEMGEKMGALGSLAGIIATAATEQADERIWTTLPSSISIARINLKPGVHQATISTPQGPRTVQLSVSGQYAIIPLRLLDQSVIVPTPRTTEQLAAADAVKSAN
ncbi:COG3014 family protein [Aquitalea magnusonii]|uniref:Lipoprotein n=1 Tax=Aquitalea magnusonii TaxID=332411 RepID=A0A318K6F9_9NEIS|nr:hypothetical protein [Aquitalea magnusonii]PXX49556.1 hypothetical protein DFR38_104200 [Aquitalea magnusonii]